MEVFGFGSQTGNQGTGPGACDILRGLKTNHKIWTKRLSSSQADKKMQGHSKALYER